MTSNGYPSRSSRTHGLRSLFSMFSSDLAIDLGTAKGFVFLSLEDETGIANVILAPDTFEQNRVTVTRNRFLLIEGILQNQDGVIHVKAQQITPLNISNVEIRSHDFH